MVFTCTLTTPVSTDEVFDKCTKERTICQGDCRILVKIRSERASYGRGFWDLICPYHAAGGRPTRTDEASAAGKSMASLLMDTPGI